MQLAYRRRGDERNPALIIVHGLYGASDNWLSVAAEFEDKFNVILVDQRNHGKSPHHAEHTYQCMSQDLLELMTNLKIEKASFIGHSMGGKTVMRFALEYPAKVEKLIVVDIAPKSYGSFSNYAQVTADHLKIIDKLSGLDPSKYENRRDISSALKPQFPDKNLRAFLMKNIKRHKDGRYYWILNFDALRNNLEELMDGFSRPSGRQTSLAQSTQPSKIESIFIRGEKSPYIQDEDSMEIYKFFPKAQIVSIPDAGHWVHAEQHDLFVKTVRYFLEE